jgi:hypothetical protein
MIESLAASCTSAANLGHPAPPPSRHIDLARPARIIDTLLAAAGTVDHTWFWQTCVSVVYWCYTILIAPIRDSFTVFNRSLRQLPLTIVQRRDPANLSEALNALRRHANTKREKFVRVVWCSNGVLDSVSPILLPSQRRRAFPPPHTLPRNVSPRDLTIKPSGSHLRPAETIQQPPKDKREDCGRQCDHDDHVRPVFLVNGRQSPIVHISLCTPIPRGDTARKCI